MKKTGFLLILCLAVSAHSQQGGNASAGSDRSAPTGTVPTNVSFPVERIQTPTYADLACAGFVSKQLLPDVNFVAGGLQTPNTTKFANNELIYLSGKEYQLGQQYAIVRELRDPNRYELFAGQHAMLKAMGQPYAELGRIRIIDIRNRMAVGHVEFSCEPIVPGDLAIPYVEKPAISFHPPMRFDLLMPSNGKTSGKIVMARDFDGELGTGMKVYMNVGTNQGVKPGDYFRAFRPYETDLNDSVDSLSFKASTFEDTQARPASIDASMWGRPPGPVVHVRDMPRRSLGEIVILNATPTSSTGMIVFALEDIHLGDGVEQDPQ
jgi:hypothetical protein